MQSVEKVYGGDPRDLAGDPDLDDLGPTENLLDQLKADLNAAVVADEVTYPISTREGYSARFSTGVDAKKLSQFRKKCTDKTMADGVDGVKVCCLALAEYNTAILFGDKVVKGADGEPLTFRSKALQEMTGTTRAAEAVRAFYGLDAPLLQHANALTDAAGLGEDAVEASQEDPT